MEVEFGVFVTLFVALLGFVGAVLGVQSTRISQVENNSKAIQERLEDVQSDNRKLWAYNRELIDYAYTWRRAGSPVIPNPPLLSEDR